MMVIGICESEELNDHWMLIGNDLGFKDWFQMDANWVTDSNHVFGYK